MCDARVRLVDDLELLYTSAEYQRKVRLLESVANQELDNESKEQALVGDVISKFALAGQISREKSVSDHGIDMEVEFKNDDHTASGQLIFLQLKSGDSYIRTLVDGKEIFTIKNDRHAEYWANQIAPVMLVIRNSVGEIRWMEIRDHLREKRKGGKAVRQIEFKGARFDAESSGPVFRPITRWGKLGEQGLHESSVNTILASCATLARLDYAPDLSSHSLRRGMATSAHRAGADFRDIKRQGGWRHDGTVHGYIEEAGRFESNAAGALLRKNGAGT